MDLRSFRLLYVLIYYSLVSFIRYCRDLFPLFLLLKKFRFRLWECIYYFLCNFTPIIFNKLLTISHTNELFDNKLAKCNYFSLKVKLFNEKFFVTLNAFLWDNLSWKKKKKVYFSRNWLNTYNKYVDNLTILEKNAVISRRTIVECSK